MSDKNVCAPAYYIGGQAVIEGVMMRGRDTIAMAVNTEKDGLVLEKIEVKKGFFDKEIFKLPLLRGVAAFVNSMIIGTKTIMRSADLAVGGIEEEEESKFEKFLKDKLGDKLNDVLIYISVIISFAFSLALFFMLPVFIGSLFAKIVPAWALGAIESSVRLIIFFAYIFLISRMKEMQRIFMYHGAEHKTINCYEKGLPLTVENIKEQTRLHKRCGTSFLIIVMLVSIVVFMFVNTRNIPLRFLSRILLLPVVSGISYEVIRWAGYSSSPLVKFVSAPGLFLQKFTTAEPTDEMILAASAALKGVLDSEGNTENH